VFNVLVGDIAHWSMARAPIATATELKRLMADLVVVVATVGVGWVTVKLLNLAAEAVPAALK